MNTVMNKYGASSLPLAGWRAHAVARWRALTPRDRRFVAVAATVIGLLLAWWIAVQPAWRTVRDAPALIDRLDAQLQQMQRLAAEGRELRGTPPVSPGQSASVLQAATARLGDRARLAIAGDRATLTLNGASSEQLRAWLSEARSGARARPLEAQLSRGTAGYSGTLVVALGGTSG
jgi:general secretion pathway protein M